MSNYITKKSKYITKKPKYITKKKQPYITKKDSVPEVDLDYINEILEEPTEKAREIFKNNFKKGGLVTKGKPKLAKKGWR